MPESATKTKHERVRKLLLDNRAAQPDGFWGPMSNRRGAQPSRQCANEFLLACVINMMMQAESAWKNAAIFAKTFPSNPDELWLEISNVPESTWKSNEYRRKSAYTASRTPTTTCGT